MRRQINQHGFSRYVALTSLLLILMLATACMDRSDTTSSNFSTTQPAELRPAGPTTRIISPGTTLVVIGQAVEPSVSKSMDDYVNQVGQVPAGFMFYMILSGDVERTKTELSTMGAFLDRYQGTVLQLGIGYGPELTGNSKESVALLLGQYDDELESIGQWLASRQHMSFVRPGYEFDRACGTYGPSTLYKSAFRYMVDHLRKHTTQVQFVMHSAGSGTPLDNYGLTSAAGGLSRQTRGGIDPLIATNTAFPFISLCPIADFFPGKDYVDYFSISYWGEGGLNGQGTDASAKAYREGVEKMLTDARNLGLPLMISESTPAYIGTNAGPKSVLWIHDYFDLIEKFDIRLFSYIGSRWLKEGGNWGSPIFNGFFPDDATVHSNPEVLAAWRQRLASPRYVQADTLDPEHRFNFQGATARLPWVATPEPQREVLQWPNCRLPSIPGTGGWCLPPLP